MNSGQSCACVQSESLQTSACVHHRTNESRAVNGRSARRASGRHSVHLHFKLWHVFTAIFIVQQLVSRRLQTLLGFGGFVS